MSSSAELDLFFGVRKDPSWPAGKLLLDRRPSFRDIQGVVSKMNPELLKNVIQSGSSADTNANVLFPCNRKPFLSVPSTPNYRDQIASPALPSLSTPSSFSRSASFDQSMTGSAPLTIFYNGTVSVYHVSPQQAENILKFAHGGGGGNDFESKDFKLSLSSNHQQQLLEGDLPIARKKSLKRFLEKRKER